MKLALGTAQFGMDYGATNKKGKVPLEQVREILTYAHANNISVVDTASAYEESEAVIGRLCHDMNLKFQLVTKTMPKKNPEEVRNFFLKSLDNLRTHKIYGLLVYNADDLFSEFGPQIWNFLLELKVSKVVEKIGVSVYTDKQIRLLLPRYDIDLIQLPVNILDQRLLNSGVLTELKSRNIEIHARSLFLQGVILKRPEALPNYFEPYMPYLYNWRDFLSLNNLTPIKGALAFVKSIKEIDFAVVGSTSLEELSEIRTSFDKEESILKETFKQFSCEERALIDPTQWKITL